MIVVDVRRQSSQLAGTFGAHRGADVMFWSTFNKLQLSPDQLRPYTGYLYGFAGDLLSFIEVLELRPQFLLLLDLHQDNSPRHSIEAQP